MFQKFDMKFPLSNKTQTKPERHPTQVKRDYTVNTGVKNLEESFLQDYVSVFQKQFDHLLEKNLNLVNENIQLKIDKNQLTSDNEIFKLEAKSVQEKLSKEKYLVELKLNDASEYINDLIEETKILRTAKSDQVKDVNSKLARYTKDNKELESTLEKRDSKIEELQVEIENLVNDLKITAGEVEELKSKNEKLLNDQVSIEHNHLDKIEKIQAQHANEIQTLQERIDDFTKNNSEQLKVSEENVKEQYKDLIAKKDEKINLLLNQNKHIKTKYKENNETAKETFEKYKQSLAEEQGKVKELNVVIIEERKKAQQLEELLKNQKHIEKKLPQRKKHEPVKKKQEVVGKLFEINNNPIWEVKGHDDKHYTFLEVKDLILSKKISESNFVRREKQWWKKVKELPEFKIEYFKKEVDGKLHVYIERESFRVPVSTPLYFNTMNSDFRGKCLNISTGGCFIEVQDFSAYDLKTNDEVNIEFEGDTFKEGFSLKGIIKEVTPAEQGVGIQFIDVDTADQLEIQNLVNQFLAELDQAV